MFITFWQHWIEGDREFQPDGDVKEGERGVNVTRIITYQEVGSTVSDLLAIYHFVVNKSDSSGSPLYSVYIQKFVSFPELQERPVIAEFGKKFG